ncbi:MAG: PAS domain S-box protein [Sulfurimonas sp.]|nr:PAS domain S-box protein [Sulfurimonas sp.]
MKKKNFASSKKLFLKITFILFITSIALTYYSSIYMRDVALNNLAEDDAKKTTELAFEVLYTKMQEGWAREDLYKIIERLNSLKPGLKIHTYRSTLVEELFGKVESERSGLNDPLIQKALTGETVFITTEDDTIRYIQPMIVKHECITCHYNSKIGDVNGVIDMTFPHNDIKIPLDSIITYFLIFTVVAIVLTFLIFQFFMTRMFLTPIATFVQSITDVKKSGVYSEGVTCAPKTYEIHMLEQTFNELLAQINCTLEELKYKNKILLEYKKAIDKSTIVSKTDQKGVITYVNDKFCEISGYAEEELIGKNHNIVRSPHMPKEAFKELWETIKNKETWSGVVENRAKNGNSYFVQATVIPILDDNNEIVEYIGTRQDITELKNLQFQELSDTVDQALQVHLQDIVNYIPVSALIVDRESNILFTNHIFNSKFSYLNREKISLDTLFIEKEGYVSSNLMLNWKDEVAMLQDGCTQKILVNIFNEESEFYVSVKELDKEGYYLVLLFETDNNLFG